MKKTSRSVPSATDVVLLGGARTPFGRLNGGLGALTAVELGAHAIRHALRHAGVDPTAVDAVIMGQVIQAGAGQNPARQASVAAGIGWQAPATTVNKVCLSGLSAIIDAARMIRVGEAHIVVAGGQESMTNGPHLLPRSRHGWKYGDVTALDSAAHDGLTDAFNHLSMGASTEGPSSSLGISRQDQDEVAAASHQRALQAAADGIFDDEIVPVAIPQRSGNDLVIAGDDSVRTNVTVDSLSTLRPAFAVAGTLTAGNSSPLTDGAAAVVLTTRAHADRLGLAFLAVLGACGQVAGPDNSLHSQPARAIERALDRSALSVGDLDIIEINEAFAAVTVQSMRELDYPHERINIHGGAIALGHPIGASGARLALHAALELGRHGGRAAVSLCGGGGQGEALLLARVT